MLDLKSISCHGQKLLSIVDSTFFIVWYRHEPLMLIGKIIIALIPIIFGLNHLIGFNIIIEPNSLCVQFSCLG